MGETAFINKINGTIRIGQQLTVSPKTTYKKLYDKYLENDSINMGSGFYLEDFAFLESVFHHNEIQYL